MPEPPRVSLFTQYVLENPYPLGVLLVALAAGFGWTALRSDRPQRLRTAGITAVTTGFFRPGYFYNYGFRVEKRYAGLFKSLTEEED